MTYRPIRRSYVTGTERNENFLLGTKSEVESDYQIGYERIISDDGPSREWKGVEHVAWQHFVSTNHSWNTFTRPVVCPPNRLWERVEKPTVFNPMESMHGLIMEEVGRRMNDAPPDWDRIVRTAAPSLRNDFNTINFLAEIGDVPNMARYVRDVAKSMRHVPKLSKDLLHGTGVKPGELLGSTTEAVLMYNLGLKPFIGDLQTMNDNVLDYFVKERKKKRKIDNYRKNIENGIKSGARRQMPIQISAGFSGPGSLGFGYADMIFNGTLTVRDHVHVIGSLGGPNPFAYLLDNAGLYPDLHTLWNALPFSFLVDYVIPVGDTLEAEFGSWSWQTAGLIGNGLRLLAAMTSVKVQGEYRFLQYPCGESPTYCDNFFLHPTTSAVFQQGQIGLVRGKYKSYSRYLQPAATLDGIDGPSELIVPFAKNEQRDNVVALMHSFYTQPRLAKDRRLSRVVRRVIR